MPICQMVHQCADNGSPSELSAVEVTVLRLIRVYFEYLFNRIIPQTSRYL